MSGLTPFGTIFNTIWSLVFIAPLYIVLSTVLSQALIYLHQLSKDRTSIISRYLGDISWAFPFTGQNEFRITQVLLVAITLALLSMLILAFMIYSTYGENKYQMTKKRLLEEIEKEQEKINKEEQANAAERREEEDRRKEEDEKARADRQKENEKQKKTSDKITQEMQKRRQQELEEMKRKQEEMQEEDKKYQEERRSKLEKQKNQ